MFPPEALYSNGDALAIAEAWWNMAITILRSEKVEWIEPRIGESSNWVISQAALIDID